VDGITRWPSLTRLNLSGPVADFTRIAELSALQDLVLMDKANLSMLEQLPQAPQITKPYLTKWRALPVDFPPWRTVWGFMARWAASDVVGQIRDQLSRRIRRELGKGPRAVATVIDSQSVKAADTVSKATRGYDAGKKSNGRKRHLVVDTRGLPLLVMVTPADLHDSQAAKEVLFRLRLMHPEITIVWADSAYAGKLVDWAKKHLNLTTSRSAAPRTPPASSYCPAAGSSRGVWRG
jgi:transposase